jgi:hypothetical protein
MKLAVVAEVITHERTTELVTEMQEGKISKGACIRTLFAGGLEVKEISTITGIRYNHVYNVVKNEVLMHGLEVEVSSRNNENSKKNQILVLLSQGKSITEISKELQCMYNYVWQIAKAGGYTGKKVSNANTEETVVAESEEKPKKKDKAKIA